MPNRIFIFYFLFCLVMNIHIYNLFYICTGTHACMGFVPDNKLIRIRIRIRMVDHLLLNVDNHYDSLIKYAIYLSIGYSCLNKECRHIYKHSLS